MKITAAELTASQRKNIFISVLMFFMFAGIAAGVIFFIADAGKSFIMRPVFNQYLIKDGTSASFFKILSRSFISLEMIILFQMICGFFAVGQPLCVLTLFHRGAAGGISAALIYESYGLKGFLIIAVMLLFPLLFNMYIMVLGARESIRFSNILACYVLGGRTERKADIKFYYVKFAVLTFMAAVCSILDSLLTFAFSGLLK